ncbi:MAG TPA: HPr family phosphocarrier protein [Thermodesulfobacteriota bacterium]|nr:HPr family phosphocarrier protein [Thermodesulfobacteriota bacterium]
MLVRREVAIVNRLGMHARAAAAFVKLAGRFQCSVEVEKDGVVVNGKSIMGLMMLAAARGSTVTLICNGPDAEPAAAALEQLIRERFGEPE